MFNIIDHDKRLLRKTAQIIEQQEGIQQNEADRVALYPRQRLAFLRRPIGNFLAVRRELIVAVGVFSPISLGRQPGILGAFGRLGKPWNTRSTLSGNYSCRLARVPYVAGRGDFGPGSGPPVMDVSRDEGW
jgi:hypothetical protein